MDDPVLEGPFFQAVAGAVVKHGAAGVSAATHMPAVANAEAD